MHSTAKAIISKIPFFSSGSPLVKAKLEIPIAQSFLMASFHSLTVISRCVLQSRRSSVLPL
ncbi:MAG: hypothetical protein AB9903_12375 [Vulcanimicrobiota bacterium]